MLRLADVTAKRSLTENMGLYRDDATNAEDVDVVLTVIRRLQLATSQPALCHCRLIRWVNILLAKLSSPDRKLAAYATNGGAELTKS